MTDKLTAEQRKAARVAERRESRATEHALNELVDNAVTKVAADPKVPSVSPTNAQIITKAVQEEVTPVLVNAANAESPVQSRILWGAVIASLATIVPLAINTLHQLGLLTDVNITAEQVTQVGGALVTLGGLGFVFYGRLKKGLKPLFWKGNT